MMLLRPRERSGKQRDPFKQQHNTWLRAYADAYSVRERFPKVEQIVFEMVFTDLKELARYSPQMRRFSPSAKAFFAFACPRTLCLGGGFDLDSIIVAMLDSGATASIGNLECHGCLAPARSENANCLLQLHYRIQISYGAPPTSASGRPSRI
jgi:hypothetical protein